MVVIGLLLPYAAVFAAWCVFRCMKYLIITHQWWEIYNAVIVLWFVANLAGASLTISGAVTWFQSRTRLHPYAIILLAFTGASIGYGNYFASLAILNFIRYS